MRRPGGVITLVGTVVLVSLATGCGGDDTASVSVPDAPGAALTDRVLAADELGIDGFTGSSGAVVAQDPEEFLKDDCDEERARSLELLDANGAEAVARRGFTAPGGGGLSVVWQFATPAGPPAWQKEVIRQTTDPAPECVPSSITRTDTDTHPVEGLPNGTAVRIAQTGSDGPAEAWNVFYTDGRFGYVVGAVGKPGTVSEEMVVAAAQRQWERRAGG